MSCLPGVRRGVVARPSRRYGPGRPAESREVDRLSGCEHPDIEGHAHADALIHACAHGRTREIVIAEDLRADTSMQTSLVSCEAGAGSDPAPARQTARVHNVRGRPQVIPESSAEATRVE